MRTRGRHAEVIAGVEDADLSGQTAVVTGATGGIGREIALALARLGADLHVHGRDPDAGRSLVDDIESTGVSGTFHRADFTSVDEINALGETLDDAIEETDIIVHNAGAHFQAGALTSFGMERTFQVNHFAPYLLTEHLRPLPSHGRVVVVASEIHRRGYLEGSFSASKYVDEYDGFDQYATSKLANVLYADALSRRLERATVNSCHPGFVPSSGLWRDSRTAIQVMMRMASLLPQRLVNRLVDTPAQAAATPVFLAASDTGGEVTGRYFVDCEQTPPSELGRDAELADALLSWSEAKLGIPS